MMEPSLLLTDEGDGSETVTVYATDFDTTDPSGNTIPNPSENGITYPAVVNPTDASLMFQNASNQSMNNYDIVIFSIPNPNILLAETRMVWSRDNTPMVSQGAAVPIGRGAWGVRAVGTVMAVDEPLYRPTDEPFIDDFNA